MSDIKWIKITTDMFEDEKIDFISSLPEADSLIVIWIRLLALAGKCNAGGYILLTEKIPYTDEMLAHKFKKPLNTVRLALETFRRLEMIENDEFGFFLPKWEKHQEVDKLEKIRKQTRSRVQDHRQRSKLELQKCNVTVTEDVTLSNATELEQELELDIETDKEQEQETEIPPDAPSEVPPAAPSFEMFWDIYPRKLRKQDALKVWNKLVKERASPEDIIQAAENYAAECIRKETLADYIMHPPTFLNKERWKDYLDVNGGGQPNDGGVYESRGGTQGSSPTGNTGTRQTKGAAGRITDEQYDSLGIGH